jgi:hypothetical protein
MGFTGSTCTTLPSAVPRARAAHHFAVVSGQGGGHGECVRVHWYTMSKQAGQGGDHGECVRVHWYNVCNNPG